MQQNTLEPAKKFVLTLFFFAISYSIIPFYTAGDQEHYRAFYEQVKNLGFADGFLAYNAALGSSEPVYYIFVFFASRLIEKDLFISIVNAVLFMAILSLAKKFKPPFWLLALIFSNFYILVLAFAAERLKFAALFFFLSFTVSDRARWIFLALSVLSHIQILIPLLIKPTLAAYINLKKALNTGKLGVRRSTLLYTIPITLSLLLISSQILFKLPYYIQNGGIDATLKPLAFLVLTLLICKRNYTNAIVSHLLITVSAFFLGSERIAIYSYIIFLYFYLQYNKLNFRFYLLSAPHIFFSITGFVFLYNTILFGNGFHS